MAAEVSCPLEIASSAIAIKAEPGWTPFVPFPLQLYTAGMSGGPPGSFTRLRGEPLKRKAKVDSITRFTFDGTDLAGGVWLDCRYGEAGELSVWRRLDSTFRQCTITHFKEVPNTPRRIEIACQ